MDHFIDALSYVKNLKGAFMGCDIHWYSETKKDGVWVCDQAESFCIEDGDTNDAYTAMDSFPGRERDYWWFGFIQPDVRSTWDFGFEASSLPEDLSKEVAEMVSSYGQDGHSHGHLTRADFIAKLNHFQVVRTEQLINPDDEHSAVQHFIERLEKTISNLTSDVPDEDQRVVFFFDN